MHLPTTYDGITYRSRTEARWAVALTAAGIPFEYEAEGFMLSAGCYLPDFWLPRLCGGMWLEVKPKYPDWRDVQLFEQLADKTGHSLLVGIGAPNPGELCVPIVNPGEHWHGILSSFELFCSSSPALIARRAFTNHYGHTRWAA